MRVPAALIVVALLTPCAAPAASAEPGTVRLLFAGDLPFDQQRSITQTGLLLEVLAGANGVVACSMMGGHVPIASAR